MEFEALKCDLAPLAEADLGADLPTWFTLEWYARAVGTIALNAHRVEGMVPPSVWAEGGADAAAGSAVFGTASLFNHSCVPNVAHTVWASPPEESGQRGTGGGGPRLHFHATRSVRKGEELVIAYVDVELDRAARRQHLLFNYGFGCDCPKCAAGVD